MIRNLQFWSKLSYKCKESKSVLNNLYNRNYCDTSVSEFIETDVNEVRLLGEVVSEVSGNSKYAGFIMVTQFKKFSSSPVKSFHRIVTFNPNLIKYVKMSASKGTRIYVSGKLTYNLRSDSSYRGNIISNKIIILPESEFFKN